LNAPPPDDIQTKEAEVTPQRTSSLQQEVNLILSLPSTSAEAEPQEHMLNVFGAGME
jgi:hypothetical protein